MFAPVGNDCPFNAKDIGSKRVTEWRCRNRVSTHQDDWQVNPYQRICSRSWTGRTWFFPSNKLDERRATIQAAVANAKNNQRFLSRGVEAAELMMEGIPKDQKESLHAMLPQVDTVDHSQARKKAKSNQPTMFEFCCSKESTFGYVNVDRGINHFRLTKDITDLINPEDVKSLKKPIEQVPGCDLWGSLPCDPWLKMAKCQCCQIRKSLC